MKNSIGLALALVFVLVSAAHALELVSPPNDHWTNYPPVQFSFILENSSGNQTNSTPVCELFLDSIPSGALMENDTEQTYWFMHDLDVGRHEWYVKCDLTNTTNVSETRNVTLDQTKPAIDIYSPLPQTYQETDIEITFAATDNLDDIMDCSIQIVSSTYNSQQDLEAENGANITLNVTLDDGDYTAIIICDDSAGNSEMNAVMFSVETPKPFFEVTMLQENPKIGDIVQFQIGATNNSDVTITIVAPNGNTYVWDYQNQTFPKTETLPYTKRSGEYILSGTMTYDGTSQTISRTFNIENTLTADVQGETTINEGEKITLEAEVTDGYSPYTVKWEMHNGTVIEGTEFSMKYDSRGTYNVELLVNDTESNTHEQDVAIKVKKLYRVLVKVIDTDTGDPINDAFVELGYEENETNSTGWASFIVREGEHELYVEKTNYKDYKRDYDIDENQTITVELKNEHDNKPEISLKTEDGAVFAEEAVLKFSVFDIGELSCSLYINDQQDDWYSLEETMKNLDPDAEYEFVIEKPEGDYLWKVECTNEYDNSDFSEEREFTIDPEYHEEIIEADEAPEIKFQLPESKESKEVADLLGLEKQASKANKEISWLVRDINNLYLRNDIDSDEKSKKRQEMEQRIEDYLKSTPLGLQVLDSTTIITYPDETDIMEALIASVGEEEAESLFKQNKNLQNILTVTTKAYHVELIYEEKTELITLINKQITIGEEGPYFLVELVPKEAAQTADDLTIITEHQVLENDPIIRFNLGESIIYYVKGQKLFPTIQETVTVIISRQKTESGALTGFSIKGMAGSPYGIGVFILLGIIIAVIVARKTGVIEKITKRKPKTETKTETTYKPFQYSQVENPSQELPQEQSQSRFAFLLNIFSMFSKKQTSDPLMDTLIQQAFQLIGQKQLDLALAKYSEITNHYAQIPDYLKAGYNSVITEICHTIDANTAPAHLMTLKAGMATGDVQGSMELFNYVQQVYLSLPENYRKEISYDYHEVQNRIEELRSMILHDLRSNDE